MRVKSNSFDVAAMMFGIKLVFVLVLLMFTAHYGTQAMVARLYPSTIDTAEIDAKLAEVYEQREIRRLLESEVASVEETVTYIEPRTIEHAYIDAHVPDKGKFVGADLKTMTMYLYEDGVEKESLPILSKGRPGTPWDTPSGLYTINTKETDHFSSIGKVHMPYSMQFFGNFFVHGWPYYPDGTPVDEGYSGGCIRMASGDAQKMFKFVDIKTPLYVYDTDVEPNDQPYQLAVRNIPTPPVSALSYIVADLETGDVLVEKNSRFRRPIASITKLMTAIVANETIAYNRPVPVPYKGKSYEVNDLLYPLMLKSDNSVADAMAAYYGTNNFLSWMNQKAKALQMNNTEFDDPSGLSYKNQSTAADLFRLARYLYDKKEFILAISKEKKKTIASVDGVDWAIKNQNRYAGDAHFVGGKLGFTDEALKTGLSIFAVPFDDDIRYVAVVVLGSNDWKTDSDKLVAWLQRAAEPRQPFTNMGAVGAAQEGWKMIREAFTF